LAGYARLTKTKAVDREDRIYTSKACSQNPVPTVTLASPQAQIEGKSQSQWQDTWWKLASAIPKSKNPLLSENAFPKLGSVQFLAGVGGGCLD
jgi:hypothetical protein